MGNILLDNQKTEMLYKNLKGDIVLYTPDTFQDEELKKIISQSESINENKIENELELKHIREIFRMLVKDGNFVDDLSDETLISQLTNGNRDVELLLREINDLVNRIQEDILYENTEKIKLINSALNIFNSNIEMNKMEEKINKLFKKYKINYTFDDIRNIQDNPEKIEEFLNKINKKK